MPKGQKTCGKCGEITGPRSYECPKCKTPFTIHHKYTKPPGGENTSNEPKIATTLQTETGPKKSAGITYIEVPGQSQESFCPIRLKSRDEKDVREWINKLADYRFQFCGNLAAYSREAIKYFGLDHWPMYLKEVEGENPEYTKFCQWVDEELKDYV